MTDLKKSTRNLESGPPEKPTISLDSPLIIDLGKLNANFL